MQTKLTESTLAKSLVLTSPFFLWGTAMVAMKGAIPHTTPFFMAGIRLLPAGVLVLIVSAFMGQSQPKGWLAWLWISLFALVDGALFQGFLAEGLVRTGAGLGSVMIDSQPLAVAIMARFLFAEMVGVCGWLGLGIGVIGISFLGLPDDWILQVLHGDLTHLNFQLNGAVLKSLFDQGEWLMLLAALSMALGTVMVRFVSRHVDPVVATGWHMIIGGVPLFVLSGLQESNQWSALTGTDWLALAYSTVLGSALAYAVFFWIASSGNLTSFSSLTFLTPVFALLFGNLFLAEQLTSIQWIGVCLTLVSIYLVNQREHLLEGLPLKGLFGQPKPKTALTQSAGKPDDLSSSRNPML